MEKILYCPFCDKYVKPPLRYCPFCSSHVVYLYSWDSSTDEEKELWKKEARHEPPEPLRGGNLLKDAERFDAQYRTELAAEEARKQYVPHCPTCGCPDLERVGAGEKLANIAVWGVFSKKPRVQFRCKNCGYEW